MSGNHHGRDFEYRNLGEVVANCSKQERASWSREIMQRAVASVIQKDDANPNVNPGSCYFTTRRPRMRCIRYNRDDRGVFPSPTYAE